MDILIRASLALCIFSCALFAAPSTAQSYPSKPIRLIVPFPPGGINDTVARPVVERMKSALGNVVIENQSGAGGVVGASAVARANADGYTLLMGSAGTHVVGPLTVAVQPYEPLKDFRSLSILALSGIAIAVHPSLPVKTLKELVDFAGTQSRPLSYASAGIGAATHLAGELFKSLARVPGIAHVPYKGGAPAMADLLGGACAHWRHQYQRPSVRRASRRENPRSRRDNGKPLEYRAGNRHGARNDSWHGRD
ncbi:MAG: Bug family tripartite tricarboxylate transporter substrate binding protein [Burkholderiales bacterium]